MTDKKKTTKTPAAPQYKIKKQITLPHLKLKLDEAYYLKITSAMAQAKEQEKYLKMTPEEKANDATYKAPPVLCNVINLLTGEECQIITNAVLASILNDEYADDGYVNLGFQVTMHPKKSGKNYHTFTVSELELGD